MPMISEDKLYSELELFAAFVARYGVSPSLRDFMEEADLSSTSVADYHLKRMAEFGWVTKADYTQTRDQVGAARSWILTDEGQKLLEKARA